MTEGKKTCLGCGRDLPFSAFHKQGGGRYGLRSRCIECRNLERRTWRKENPEKARAEWTRHNKKSGAERMARYRGRHPDRVKASRKQSYEKHRERRLEGMRRWRTANPEKAKAAEARWRKANPERKAELQREYAERHPDRVLANLKRWQQQNPRKYRDQVLTKRARRRGAEMSGEAVIVDDIIQRDQGHCGICGEPIMGPFHIDHVLPIAGGGTHEPNNIQMAHPTCNARKWAKLAYTPPG